MKPADNIPDQTESLLARQTFGSPSSNVWKRIEAQVITAPARQPRQFPWLAALAAGTLVAVGGWWWSHTMRSNAVQTSGAHPTETTLSGETITVLEILSCAGQPCAVLADLGRRESYICRVGDSVGAWTVAAISSDGVQLTSANAPAKHLVMTPAALRQLLNRPTTQPLQRPEFELLGAYARRGDAAALERLQTIALQDGEVWQQEAWQLLAEGKHPKNLLSLVEQAKNRNYSNRLYVLNCMKNISSPLVLALSRAIAADATDPQQALAIDMLAAFHDACSLKLLQSLSADASQPADIRVKARAAVAQIAGMETK